MLRGGSALQRRGGGRFWRSLLGVAALSLPFLLPHSALAQPAAVAQTSKDPLVEARELRAWIERIQDASRSKNYTGTFVVTSALGLTTTRISHAASGREVFEQLELMDGLRRTQLRANNVVHTVYPDQRIATVETRDTLDSFPGLMKNDDMKLSGAYELRAIGEDRVAGHASRVVHLKPRDALRFGMRLWVEEKTGLLLKSQLLGTNGEVLEQVAFSDVAINVPFQGERIKAAIKRLDGYRVEQVRATAVSAREAGWRMSARVSGFREVTCMKREMRAQPIFVETTPAGKPREVLQWVFSDGLGSVSLFLEPYSRELHAREGLTVVGATHTLSTRKGDWWVTVLGEVPATTLQSFAQALERVPK
jgi:sigma-E factor negative regulatory protein RseB